MRSKSLHVIHCNLSPYSNHELNHQR
jgi:hypothetical protein